MRKSVIASFFLLFAGALAYGADTQPATLPAIDYSSPRGVLRSFMMRVNAGDLDAFEKCVVPAADQRARDVMKYVDSEEFYSLAVSRAVLDRFGAKKAPGAARDCEEANSILDDVDKATEIITGDTAKIVPADPGPQPTSRPGIKTMSMRKVAGEWRVDIPPTRRDDAGLLKAKAEREMIDQLVKDIREGRFKTVDEVNAAKSERYAALIPPK